MGMQKSISKILLQLVSLAIFGVVGINHLQQGSKDMKKVKEY
jgi:hypothetical protein